MENDINIVLVDDHTVVRNGIKAMIKGEKGLCVVGESADGLEAVSLVDEIRPDIAIVDIRMPKMSGLDAINELSKKNLQTRYIVLSMHDSQEYVLNAIRAGAHGYVLKDIEKNEFVKAIRSVNQGEKYFSADISQIVIDEYLGIIKGDKLSVPEEPSTESTKTLAAKYGLTKREVEIMQQALSGKSNKEIAEVLGKSVRTVETHRFNMMKKMKAKNIAELNLRIEAL